MKPCLFLIPLLVACQSCIKEDLGNSQNNKKAIRFEVYNTLSKENSPKGNTLFKQQNTCIGVTAFHGKQLFMNDVPLENQVGTTECLPSQQNSWNYVNSNDISYWPQNIDADLHQLTFYAYAPYKQIKFSRKEISNNYHIDTKSQSATIDYIISPQITDSATNRIDLLYARQSVRRNPYTSGYQQNDAVNLQFKHALSAIYFSIATKQKKIYVLLDKNAITLHNICSQGQFTFPNNDTNEQGDGTWGQQAIPADYTNLSHPLVANTQEIAVNNDYPNHSTDVLMIIPQNLQPLYITDNLTANPTQFNPNDETGNYVSIRLKMILDIQGKHPIIEIEDVKQHPEHYLYLLGNDDTYQTIYLPLRIAQIARWEPGVSYHYHMLIDAENLFKPIRFKVGVENWINVNKCH